MQRSDCRQKEAFCLMLYRDEATGEVEIIWNSRDAVTPLGVTSRNGNNSLHIAWLSDLFSPFHVPAIGDRVLVDLTLEEARRQRTAYVERWWDGDGGAPMSAQWPTKEAAIEELAQFDVEQFGGHCPHVAVVDEALQRTFLEAAAKRLGARVVTEQ